MKVARTYRRFMPAIAGMVAAVVAALVPAVALAQQQPIKIGTLRAHTGFLAKQALMKTGEELALSEVGGRVAGRNVVLVSEDTQGRPDVASTKLKRLVEEEKVQMVIGPEISSEGLATRNYVHGNKVLQLMYQTGANELTEPGKLASPYIFRMSYTNRTVFLVPAVYANQKGLKRAALIALDYASGREAADTFASAFKGEIVDRVFIPPTVGDVAPYVTRAVNLADKIDFLAIGLWGSVSARFLEGIQEAKLPARVERLAMGSLVLDAVDSGKGDLTVGITSVFPYSTELDNDVNRKFVREYQARFKSKPSFEAEMGYAGMKMVLLALNKIGGRIEDKEAFRKALQETRLDSPRGPLRFDGNQSGVMHWYVFKSKKAGSEVRNEPTGERFADVDQFWKP